LRPSSKRSRFSSSTFSEKGSFSTAANCLASVWREKMSYGMPPTLSLVRVLNVSIWAMGGRLFPERGASK
jgi:hypothetical protein